MACSSTSYTPFVFMGSCFLCAYSAFFYGFFVTCVTQDLMVDKVEHKHTYAYV